VDPMGPTGGTKKRFHPDERAEHDPRGSSGNEKDLLEIFGPDGRNHLQRRQSRRQKKPGTRFAEKYQRMNRLVEEPDGTVRLYVGAENWPMPIPLVNSKDAWYFDTSAGKEEIFVPSDSDEMRLRLSVVLRRI